MELKKIKRSPLLKQEILTDTPGFNRKNSSPHMEYYTKKPPAEASGQRVTLPTYGRVKIYIIRGLCDSYTLLSLGLYEDMINVCLMF
jgi:hypothetical protein